MRRFRYFTIASAVAAAFAIPVALAQQGGANDSSNRIQQRDATGNPAGSPTQPPRSMSSDRAMEPQQRRPVAAVRREHRPRRAAGAAEQGVRRRHDRWRHGPAHASRAASVPAATRNDELGPSGPADAVGAQRQRGGRPLRHDGRPFEQQRPDRPDGGTTLASSSTGTTGPGGTMGGTTPPPSSSSGSTGSRGPMGGTPGTAGGSAAGRSGG